MKKRFYPASPSVREMIMEAAQEQGRTCEMTFSHDEGTHWLLDGYEYTTGAVSAVLSLYT